MGGRMRWRVRLLGWLLLTGCGGGWSPIDFATLPNAADVAPHAGVVLEDTLDVRFDLDQAENTPFATLTERRRVRIFGPSARGHATAQAWYAPGHQDLLDLRVRVVDAAGYERTYGRDQAEDAPLRPSFVLFSDRRSAVLKPPVVPDDAVVETVVVTRVNDLRLFGVWFTAGDVLPVRHAAVRVSLPVDWSVRWRVTQLDAVVERPPSERVEADRRVLEWRRLDLPALVPEPHGPSVWRAAETVRLQLAGWTDRDGPQRGFETPEQLSAHMHALHAPRAQVTPRLAALAADILADAPPTPRERARRLYDWVQRNIRYCAISVGLGGWVPHAAEQVKDVGYGDCKDKANLLGVLLAADGIPSRQASVYAHDGFPLPFGLPTVAGNSNHQILIVDLPDGPVAADPTSRVVPFGALPGSAQDADLLPYAPEGAGLVRTPLAGPEANTADDALRLTLPADGGALTGAFVLRRTGTQAAALRSTLLAQPTARHAEVVASFVPLRGRPTLEAVMAEGVEATRPGEPVTVSGRLPNGGVLAARLRTLRLTDLLEPSIFRLPAVSARRTPIALGAPRTESLRIALTLPPGWTASPPPPVDIDDARVRFTLDWRQEGSTVHVQRTLRVQRGRVPADEHDALRAILEAIHAAERAPVRITPGSPGR